MKILYLTRGDHIDYQNDCLLIGLKELFGVDVVDYNKQEHNYISYDINRATQLYGMGMTVSRVLPDLLVDRTDITKKIKMQYFDFIVYGSIWRCHDYIESILQYYPKNKVIAVDGEDEINIHPAYNKGIPYFKRELIYKRDNLIPISFAFPTSKIHLTNDKKRDIAICDPRDRTTYIYKNETDYYNGYRESKFAYTIKKAGWDCMRHYEILANGCIPIFLDIDKCPEMTMTYFPNQRCAQVVNDLQTIPINQVYDKHLEWFIDYTNENLTTKALAKYFINKITKI
jgi:hypothetical protein